MQESSHPRDKEHGRYHHRSFLLHSLTHQELRHQNQTPHNTKTQTKLDENNSHECLPWQEQSQAESEPTNLTSKSSVEHRTRQ